MRSPTIFQIHISAPVAETFSMSALGILIAANSLSLRSLVMIDYSSPHMEYFYYLLNMEGFLFLVSAYLSSAAYS